MWTSQNNSKSISKFQIQLLPQPKNTRPHRWTLRFKSLLHRQRRRRWEFPTWDIKACKWKGQFQNILPEVLQCTSKPFKVLRWAVEILMINQHRLQFFTPRSQQKWWLAIVTSSKLNWASSCRFARQNSAKTKLEPLQPRHRAGSDSLAYCESGSPNMRCQTASQKKGHFWRIEKGKLLLMEQILAPPGMYKTL